LRLIECGEHFFFRYQSRLKSPEKQLVQHAGAGDFVATISIAEPVKANVNANGRCFSEVHMMRWIVLFLISSLGAQLAPAPKYKVVKGGKIAAVSSLAEQGYRLLVPGRLLIMRLDSTPPDTYRYAASNTEEGHVHFLNWLNEQGAQGYRWVPGAGLLEKEPHPKNYEYSFLPPTKPSWTMKTNPETISSLIGQGYHPVDSVLFAALIGPGGTETLFEREVGTKPKTIPTSEGWDVEIVRVGRAGTVLKQFNVLAKKGYRYLGPYDPGAPGGLGDWMQKCEPECEQGFEYRYFDVHDLGQLTKELNEQGKGGFRVVPEAFRSRSHLLERAGGENKTYLYHVVQVKDPEPLEQALNAPEQEGYVPIGFVWHIGWTGEEFLLLEKASTVSAPQ
jgi:hypothetical protein